VPNSEYLYYILNFPPFLSPPDFLRFISSHYPTHPLLFLLLLLFACLLPPFVSSWFFLLSLYAHQLLTSYQFSLSNFLSLSFLFVVHLLTCIYFTFRSFLFFFYSSFSPFPSHTKNRHLDNSFLPQQNRQHLYGFFFTFSPPHFSSSLLLHTLTWIKSLSPFVLASSTESV
jgi:hypothetical protein